MRNGDESCAVAAGPVDGGIHVQRRQARPRLAQQTCVPAGRRTGCAVRGVRWVNVLLGNFKRAISGSYLPRHPPGQVRAAPPGRSSLPCQPAFSTARDAAASGPRHDSVQAPSGAVLADGQLFSWLRVGADPDSGNGSCKSPCCGSIERRLRGNPGRIVSLGFTWRVGEWQSPARTGSQVARPNSRRIESKMVLRVAAGSPTSYCSASCSRASTCSRPSGLCTISRGVRLASAGSGRSIHCL